jgi:hypothetical protein
VAAGFGAQLGWVSVVSTISTHALFVFSSRGAAFLEADEKNKTNILASIGIAVLNASAVNGFSLHVPC